MNVHTTEDQTIRDFGRGEITVRFAGPCIVCNCNTYDDGGDCDPRGVLGKNACQPLIASEYGMVGPDVPCCWACFDDREKHERAVERAGARWSEPFCACGRVKSQCDGSRAGCRRERSST